MGRSERWWLVVAIAVAVAGAGCTAAAEQEPPPRRPAGGSAAWPVPRLVDLGSVGCVPCKAMAPILEELRAEYAGRLEVEFIDVWKDRAAAEAYGVRVIPTQVFLGADGKELGRHQGFMGKDEILARWQALGVRL